MAPSKIELQGSLRLARLRLADLFCFRTLGQRPVPGMARAVYAYPFPFILWLAYGGELDFSLLLL